MWTRFSDSREENLNNYEVSFSGCGSLKPHKWKMEKHSFAKRSHHHQRWSQTTGSWSEQTYVLGVFVVHDGEELVDREHLGQRLGVEQFLSTLQRDGVGQSPVRVVGHHQVADVLHHLLVAGIHLLPADVSAASCRRRKGNESGVGNDFWSLHVCRVCIYTGHTQTGPASGFIFFILRVKLFPVISAKCSI